MKSRFSDHFETALKLSVSGFRKTLKTGIGNSTGEGWGEGIWQRFLDTLGMDTGFFLLLCFGRWKSWNRVGAGRSSSWSGVGEGRTGTAALCSGAGDGRTLSDVRVRSATGLTWREGTTDFKVRLLNSSIYSVSGGKGHDVVFNNS